MIWCDRDDDADFGDHFALEEKTVVGAEDERKGGEDRKLLQLQAELGQFITLFDGVQALDFFCQPNSKQDSFVDEWKEQKQTENPLETEKAREDREKKVIMSHSIAGIMAGFDDLSIVHNHCRLISDALATGRG